MSDPRLLEARGKACAAGKQNRGVAHYSVVEAQQTVRGGVIATPYTASEAAWSMSNRRAEGAGEAARRRAGLRRRREAGALLLPRPSGLAVGAVCDDGCGRGYDSLSSLVAVGGARLLGDGRSRKASMASFRRPALIFLAQALLSFVGMVVIPTRLAYELLIQPGIGTPAARAAEGSDGSIHSIDVRGTPVISPDPLAVRDHRAGEGGGGSRDGRINGDDILMSQKSRGVSSAGRTGARALQAEEGEGEDSFTYRGRTQFFVCVAEGTALGEENLRDAIMDLLAVDQVRDEYALADSGVGRDNERIPGSSKNDLGHGVLGLRCAISHGIIAYEAQFHPTYYVHQQAYLRFWIVNSGCLPVPDFDLKVSPTPPPSAL